MNYMMDWKISQSNYIFGIIRIFRKRCTMLKCELDKDINNCPYYKEGICTNENMCSFQKKEIVEPKNPYARKERWYEQYYRR